MAAKNGVTDSLVNTDESTSFPGFGPKQVDDSDLSNYKVKYCHIDIMDPGSRAQLEIIETKAIKGQGVVILTKKDYTFMDKFFLVVSYLELETNANASR